METDDAWPRFAAKAAHMDELLFATENADEDEAVDCSWASVIRGVERYAAYQPPGFAHDLLEWAILLEGIRQMREGG